jgi:hypothetical protein
MLNKPRPPGKQPIAVSVEIWKGLDEAQRKLLAKLGVTGPTAKRLKEGEIPEPSVRRPRSLEQISYTLGIMSFCKLCGSQDYVIYRMVRVKKGHEHCLQATPLEPGEIAAKADKVQYRRVPTCPMCKSILGTWKKAEVIDKAVELADPLVKVQRLLEKVSSGNGGKK